MHSDLINQYSDMINEYCCTVTIGSDKAVKRKKKHCNATPNEIIALSNLAY